MSLDEARALAARVDASVRRVIIGQHDVVEQVLITLLAGGHGLLQGVPGLAKTLLVKTLARSLDLRFSRIQFTPDLMPADVLGTEVIEEDRATGHRDVRFVPGPIFAQVILADEINRTPPRTQAALLEAMQEAQVTIAGVRHPLELPLFVLATENPIEQEGTYPLPEAQLDRFMLNIVMGYPTAAEERAIVAADHRQRRARRRAGGRRGGAAAGAPPGARGAGRRQRHRLRDAAGAGHAPRRRGVPAAWRRWVRWGAGPRAGQALVLAAKARAVMQGRPAVSLDDIRAVAPPVLRHRVLVNFQAVAEGITAEQRRAGRPGRRPDARLSAARSLAPCSRPICSAAPEVAAVRELALAAAALVAGLRHGRHAQPLVGAGPEVWGVRPYRQGDDAAQVDWKRSARGDRLYSRERADTSQTQAVLIVDASRSMGVGHRAGEPSKFEIAQVDRGRAGDAAGRAGRYRRALCGDGAGDLARAGVAAPITAT